MASVFTAANAFFFLIAWEIMVDAGSCNGCGLEIVALNNPVYDIERFGIHFVASPRHADILLVTGPVTRNMELALRKTCAAAPDPKVVVAVGACRYQRRYLRQELRLDGAAWNIDIYRNDFALHEMVV